MEVENLTVHETTDADFNDIMEIEQTAFGHDKEAKLTANLLGDPSAEPVVSLLAYYDSEAVGHILFTKVILEDGKICPLMHILAPLAVKPAYHKQGIGGMLIREGLKQLQSIGSEMIFVLGHMEYYPKFGFTPDAERQGFPAPYPIPPEYANAWMVQAITPKGLCNTKGKIVCADTLNKPKHWRE
jgi:putative acetyltransferase